MEQDGGDTGRYVIDEDNRVYDTLRGRYMGALLVDRGINGEWLYGVSRRDMEEYEAGERWPGYAYDWPDPEEAILTMQEEFGISAQYYE